MKGWIGVDLDGTLAEYHGWVSNTHIGKPIPKMVERVKAWLAQGQRVQIMTARSYFEDDDWESFESLKVLHDWMLEHIGQVLPITRHKDRGMIELWDDRAIQVIPNTGERADGLP